MTAEDKLAALADVLDATFVEIQFIGNDPVAMSIYLSRALDKIDVIVHDAKR